MNSNIRISDRVKVDTEELDISSAAGATSIKFDMSDHNHALLTACIAGTFTSAVVDLMGSTAATAAGSSAAGGKAGITIGSLGSTGISTAGGVRKITLTIGTASTTNDVWTFGVGTRTRRFQYTTSTALHNATAWTTALLYYGATEGATVADGIDNSIGLLTSAMNSTLAFPNMLDIATASTVALQISARDDALGPLSLSSGGANVASVAVNEAAVGFDISAAELSTVAGKSWVGLKISSASTACTVGITCMRAPGRYMPTGDIKWQRSS